MTRYFDPDSGERISRTDLAIAVLSDDGPLDPPAHPFRLPMLCDPSMRDEVADEQTEVDAAHERNHA